MELQQKMIDGFVAEYTTATRSEKREAVLNRALRALDAPSMLNFLSRALKHLDSIMRASEFDE
jgi:hypothetical protein